MRKRRQILGSAPISETVTSNIAFVLTFGWSTTHTHRPGLVDFAAVFGFFFRGVGFFFVGIFAFCREEGAASTGRVPDAAPIILHPGAIFELGAATVPVPVTGRGARKR